MTKDEKKRYDRARYIEKREEILARKLAVRRAAGVLPVATLTDEERAANRKAYRKGNRERINAKQRDRYATNRERINAKRRKGGQNFRPRRMGKCTQRRKCLFRAARARISVALKRAGAKKSLSTAQLLGKSAPAFNTYILIHPTARRHGFTLDNHGNEWHVDHIRPLSNFDLSIPAQQRLAFSYRNCRPMLAEANLAKCAKWHGN